jgi:hypothetical protein
MSESLDGVRVAETRQNSGRVLNAAPRPLADDVNAPAGTTCANVIFASGRARFARLSQDAAQAGTVRAHAIAAQAIE